MNNNSKLSDEILIILIIAILIAFTVILVKLETTERMKRQSIEGYVATATYKTNSAGEVKIETIDWKKK